MSEKKNDDTLKLFLISIAGTLAVTAGLYVMHRYLEKADPNSFWGQLYRKFYPELKSYEERLYKKRSGDSEN
jgi:hypothetical protein